MFNRLVSGGLRSVLRVNRDFHTINSLGEVVLITGCSSGIGKQVCIDLHEKGETVYATSRKIDDLNDLKELGIRVGSVDVCSQEDIQNMVDKIIEEEGVIDMIISNAGVNVQFPMTEEDMESVEHTYDVNVYGSIRLIQAVTPHMMKERNGKIVQISSVGAVYGTPLMASYCGSKAAISRMCEALRTELEPWNIQVCIVEPARVESEMPIKINDTRDVSNWGKYECVRKLFDKKSAKVNPRMSTEEFSEKLVEKISNEKLPQVIRLGKQAWLFPFMANYFPTAIFQKFVRGMWNFHIEEDDL